MRLHGDELGWRLAGITDGEGCFFIRPNGRGGRSFMCVFTIGVRDDDLPLLELLRDSTGLGAIYLKPVTDIARSSRPGTNPQAHWQVARLAECHTLAGLFAEYPLVSRKRIDCELWSEAVDAWGAHDWPRMNELRKELTECRKYRPPAHLITGGAA